MKQKIFLIKFRHLFYERQLPVSKVAEHFGVAISSIGAFRKRHGLPGRGWAHGTVHNKGKPMAQEQRTKISQSRKGKNCGEDNPSWKGGRYITFWGYVRIKTPDWPTAYKGYSLEHRYVMEQHLGRLLYPKDIVHHINGNKTDNRIENLCLHSRSSHAKLHSLKGSKFGIHQV